MARQELEGGSIEGLGEGATSKYKSILERYKSGRIEDNQDAERMTRELAAHLSDKEVAALQGSDGAIARNIGDVGAIEKLGGEGDTRQQFMERLRKSGLSQAYATISTIDKARSTEIEGFFSKGSAGRETLTGAELSGIKDQLRNVKGRGGPQDPGGQDSVQGKLMGELTKFADANSKFVLAVATATPNLDNQAVKDLQKQIAALGDKATQKPGT
jgi:hypothetical protein